MEAEKIIMQGVKFHASMTEITPVIKMSTLLKIAESMKCLSTIEVIKKIDACYVASTSKDKDGKDITIRTLENEVEYFKIATEILYQASATACEIAGRDPDFNKSVISSVLNHQNVFNIILWFMQQVTLMSKAEGQAEGNEPATIRITC